MIFATPLGMQSKGFCIHVEPGELEAIIGDEARRDQLLSVLAFLVSRHNGDFSKVLAQIWSWEPLPATEKVFLTFAAGRAIERINHVD